jgi:hypothetical protein
LLSGGANWVVARVPLPIAIGINCGHAQIRSTNFKKIFPLG